MTELHAIEALPRPKVKHIPINDPVAQFARQVERMLLDTSRNKDTRVREAVLMCRDAQAARKDKT